MKNHSFLKYCTSILLIFIAVACTTGNKEQKIVTVTIQPQKYFAEKIAGDRFNINCIVPPGSNPEAYDPSPSHLVHLGKSIAYFKIGHIGFELAWMDKLEQNNPNMKIFRRYRYTFRYARAQRCRCTPPSFRCRSAHMEFTQECAHHRPKHVRSVC